MMKGKSCLVSGGADGIGRATCRELLKLGAKVAICDVNEKAGCEAIEALRAEFGDRVEFCTCDVTNAQQFEGCFESAVDKFGGLDVVINCAGLCNEATHSWERLLRVNLEGTVRGSKLALKYMSKREGGRGGVVVNLGSVVILQPYPFFPVYSASKAAVNQFTRSLGSEEIWRESGVKVICVNPGKTSTKMLNQSRERLPPAVVDMIDHIPSQPAEFVGKCIVELIGNSANGSLWTVMDNQPPTPTVFS